MTYRESLEKEKITLNGNDYVPLELSLIHI